jgi:hypothetical protein
VQWPLAFLSFFHTQAHQHIMTLTRTPEHKTTTMMFPLPPCTMRLQHTSMPRQLKTVSRAAKSSQEPAFGGGFGDKSASLRTLILMSEFSSKMSQQQRKRGPRAHFFGEVVSRAGRSKSKSTSPKPPRKWSLGMPLQPKKCDNSSASHQDTHGHDNHGHDSHGHDGHGHDGHGYHGHGRGSGHSKRRPRPPSQTQKREKEDSITAAAASTTPATNKKIGNIGDGHNPHSHGGHGHGGHGHGSQCNGGRAHRERLGYGDLGYGVHGLRRAWSRRPKYTRHHAIY